MYSLNNLTKAYGTPGGGEKTVLSDISLEVAPGESVTIVGPSGAGKTTLLRCIVGLSRPTSGSVSMSGEPVVGAQADVAVVFQDYSRSLMPWLTVRRNVELPLLNKVGDRRARAERVDGALHEVGLLEHADKYPGQLSGGMQQRTALARGVAYEPKVLVMDEPFASVDAQTRGDLEDLVGSLQRAHAMTMMVVTHDIDEAVYLADRVVVLGGSPTSIVDTVDVDLPWPRDQVDTKSLPRFVELRRRVFLQIRGSGPAAGTQRPTVGEKVA